MREVGPEASFSIEAELRMQGGAKQSLGTSEKRPYEEAVEMQKKYLSRRSVRLTIVSLASVLIFSLVVTLCILAKNAIEYGNEFAWKYYEESIAVLEMTDMLMEFIGKNKGEVPRNWEDLEMEYEINESFTLQELRERLKIDFVALKDASEDDSETLRVFFHLRGKADPRPFEKGANDRLSKLIFSYRHRRLTERGR